MSGYSFEGPEKILEFIFSVPPSCQDLLIVDRPRWDTILDEAACKILDKQSNGHLDSYILSESSMFIYRNRILIKTCGTTTLLKVAPLVNTLAKELGLTLQWISYSRKNFTFPEHQKYPHQSFKNEINFLIDLYEGEGFILGPLTSDHWFLYVADYTPVEFTVFTDITLNLWMYDMDESVARQFFFRPGVGHAQVTTETGIRGIFPGSLIHEYCFEPCGYSMNGLIGESYWTIHVTPESHCSYVSFETNARMGSYSELIQQVLNIFRPSRFTLSVFADEQVMNQMEEQPYAMERYRDMFSERSYHRTVCATSNVSGGFLCGIGNWFLASDKGEAKKRIMTNVRAMVDLNEGEL